MCGVFPCACAYPGRVLVLALVLVVVVVLVLGVVVVVCVVLVLGQAVLCNGITWAPSRKVSK